MKNLLQKLLPRSNRGRWVLLGAAGAIVILTSIAAIESEAENTGMVATAVVKRGPLTISLVQSGTIRPRQQIVLSNEMDDAATIISIVPEGTVVEKGDLLVELSATEAETELVERRIRVQNGEAELIYARENLKVVENQGKADIEQAELDLKFGKQDLEKYLEGEYPMELMTLETEINLAQEELKQAEEQLRWSRILAEEKYLSDAELEQDELSARKVRLDLELARRSLEVFKEYTHQRQLAEFKSIVKQAEMALERARMNAAANLAQAEAELRASEAELEEEKARLRRAELEVARSKIYAPIAGTVLYASSVSNDWDDDEDQIEEGALVDERGEIIYLPTTNLYDVDIQIPEANLNQIEPGMPVRVTCDALAGQSFMGRITDVARLPDPRSRYLNPNLKLYNAVIQLDPIDAQLRNGMSCRAEIRVAHYADALYVPVQAVARHRGQTVVHLVKNGQSRPVKVELGLDDNRVVRIANGVAEGQHVLLAPPFDIAPPTDQERWAMDNPESMEEESVVPGENGAAVAGRSDGGISDGV